MQSVYSYFDPVSSSLREVVHQSFRKKDISTLDMFSRENLYIKNYLLGNLDTQRGSLRSSYTIRLRPLSLKTNYKYLIKQRLAPNLFRSRLYGENRIRQRLFSLSFYKMAQLQKHLFLVGRKNKLFRMKYRRLHSVLSNKLFRNTPNGELRSLLKNRAAQKYLFRVSNRKKYV